MALFRRFFYQKPPDRLLEISERVYVFDCCFSTDVLADNDYKAYMSSIVAQLQDYYPDSSFMVFNFREGDKKSPISDILEEFDMTVMEYPRQYENCPLLPLQMINHFLRSSDTWLSLMGQQNVLLMHCERGGWPLLAFMLAGLLLYRRRYDWEKKTLDMFYKQAPKELLRLLTPLNPQPSQLRYLQYISRRDRLLEWPPSDTSLVLDSLILKVLPLMDTGKCCRPVVRVYGQDPLKKSSKGSELQFSSLKARRRIRSYPEMELVKLVVGCRVQGDVVLECAHLCSDNLREEMMFRVMFHTTFVCSNNITLSREEVDILWDAKDKFPEDFRAEVFFSDLEDYPKTFNMSEDENDVNFACAEEFFEVQEIFSNTLDGADVKGDSDPSVFEYCSPDELRLKHEAYAGLNPSAVKDVSFDNGSEKQTLIDVVKDITVDDGNKNADSKPEYINHAVEGTHLEEGNRTRALKMIADMRSVKEAVREVGCVYAERLSGVNRDLEKLHRVRSEEAKVKAAKGLAMEKEALRSELACLSEEAVALGLKVAELEVANKALVAKCETIRDTAVAEFLASSAFGRHATHFSLPWFQAGKRSGVREAAQRHGFEYFEPDYCSLFGEEEPEILEYSSAPGSPVQTVDQEEECPRDITEAS